jgi:glycosyltransferase involved in cell wall biosynthesis
MRNKMHSPICSILVPANNEASVIESTLRSALRGTRHGEFDVIVACNGCSDDTAKIARRVAPDARVLELVQPSKTHALNAGVAAAASNKIVFLDADILTSAEAIRNLIHRLDWSSADLAVGDADFDTGNSHWSVEAFYKAWMQNPYFDNQKMGGFFAVSSAGLNKLGVIPATTNDDEYVRRKLGSNITVAQTATYKIKAPRTLGALIKVRSRVYRGNAELELGETAFGNDKQKRHAKLFLSRLVAKPSLWLGASVFGLVALAAHMRVHLTPNNASWETDLTNRVGQEGG